ncbi:hypothetical protein JHFBIEKO_4423 [Methylobacterium mesophilicum]|uniref:hypothetical protein n=1 Tax=Methylobacterium mesophilicum TaxID=39956 RepID=UPI001EE243B0|nr:hypothetical protein [Methylobacterium mesophilicum]GJE23957.1 hypothetical protein JHFBIEKO_4423 [Methylobacterium mesophilicum]
MSAGNPTISSSHVLAQVWLDPDLGSALDRAARDARDTRAGLLRRIILESVRLSGHLDPAPTARRHRVKRRSEIAA